MPASPSSIEPYSVSHGSAASTTSLSHFADALTFRFMPTHARSFPLLSEQLSLLALLIGTACASCFELPSCMICLDPWDQY